MRLGIRGEIRTCPRLSSSKERHRVNNESGVTKRDQDAQLYLSPIVRGRSVAASDLEYGSPATAAWFRWV
jgi:hypothetical protein